MLEEKDFNENSQDDETSGRLLEEVVGPRISSTSPSSQLGNNFEKSSGKAPLPDQNAVDPIVKASKLLKDYQAAPDVEKEKRITELDKVVSTLDQLANVNSGDKSIKFREEALHILEAVSPHNSMSIAAHHLLLSEQYRTSGNNGQSLKHFGLANDYWKEKSPSEREGDLASADLSEKGNYQRALSSYTQAASDLDHELHKLWPRTEAIPPNPHQARLNVKIAETILAQSGIKSTKALLTASEHYEVANNILKKYSETFGQGKPSPGQLSTLTSAALIECTLAQRDTFETEHWTKAVELFKALKSIILDPKLNTVDLANNDDSFDRTDYSIVSGKQLANHKDAYQNSRQDAAIILEGIYAIQKTKGKPADEQISTLQSVADAYFKLDKMPGPVIEDLGMLPPTRQKKDDYQNKALLTLETAIKVSEQAYGKYNVRVMQTIRNLADHCSQKRNMPVL